VRKFCTYGEAQSYVEGHKAAWQQERFSDESPTGRARTGEAGHEAGPHSFAKSSSDYHGKGGASPSSDGSMLYPPGKLMGEDPSMGKSEELFGIDTEQSEEELTDALCPPDLSESMAKSLINGTIDAVALPGGLNTSGGELEESASEEVGMLLGRSVGGTCHSNSRFRWPNCPNGSEMAYPKTYGPPEYQQ
jgi:hypothetical protein